MFCKSIPQPPPIKFELITYRMSQKGLFSIQVKDKNSGTFGQRISKAGYSGKLEIGKTGIIRARQSQRK